MLVGSRRVEGRIAQALIAQSLPLVVEQNREVVECLRLGRIAAVAAEAEVPVQAHVDAARLLAIGRPYAHQNVAALKGVELKSVRAPAGQHCRLHQMQAVVAKVHVVTHEHCGGAKGAALHGFFGIGFELVLDLRQGDADQKAVCIDAQGLANGHQNRILRDVFLAREIG